MNHVYDYIIVGSGISGLYCGYKLLEKKKENFLILEKNQIIGGRIKTFSIGSNKVPMGAGIGRYKKDILLKKLLTELDIQTKAYKSNYFYSDKLVIKNIYNMLYNIRKHVDNKTPLKNKFESLFSKNISDHFYKTLKIQNDITYSDLVLYIYENIKKLLQNRNGPERDDFDILVYNNILFMYNIILNNINDEVNNQEYVPATFREYVIDLIGVDNYQILSKNLSFTDYEGEDALLSVLYYGFDDNYEVNENISIKWNDLIDKLHSKLSNQIRTGCTVVNFQKLYDENFKVTCDQMIRTDNCFSQEQHFVCKKIIFANNLNVIKKFKKVYEIVKTNPFLRVYCQVDLQKSIGFLEKLRKNGSTIVDNELSKIININRDEGLFMITYSDNENADILSKYIENTPQNIRFFENYLIDALSLKFNDIKIINIYSFYWTEGTHYFQTKEPLSLDENIQKMQNPFENVYVVGECISKNQGWVEGALESVESVLSNL